MRGGVLLPLFLVSSILSVVILTLVLAGYFSELESVYTIPHSITSLIVIDKNNFKSSTSKFFLSLMVTSINSYIYDKEIHNFPTIHVDNATQLFGISNFPLYVNSTERDKNDIIRKSEIEIYFRKSLEPYNVLLIYPIMRTYYYVTTYPITNVPLEKMIVGLRIRETNDGTYFIIPVYKMYPKFINISIKDMNVTMFYTFITAHVISTRGRISELDNATYEAIERMNTRNGTVVKSKILVGFEEVNGKLVPKVDVLYYLINTTHDVCGIRDYEKVLSECDYEYDGVIIHNCTKAYVEDKKPDVINAVKRVIYCYYNLKMYKNWNGTREGIGFRVYLWNGTLGVVYHYGG